MANILFPAILDALNGINVDHIVIRSTQSRPTIGIVNFSSDTNYTVHLYVDLDDTNLIIVNTKKSY